MTVYFTTDADGHKIAERADIRRADSQEAALEALRGYYSGSDFAVVSLEAGSFGDAWLRFSEAPGASDMARLEREAGALSIQEPGQHPGGRQWWIEPASTVFVPVLRERA